ncbi:hypothetical protein K501DRAFT_279954 [Backusella circina FSU 941]|nr:hypothetical protein K501DRAFT_279954 [Backusella circina FSU 941]
MIQSKVKQSKSNQSNVNQKVVETSKRSTICIFNLVSNESIVAMKITLDGHDESQQEKSSLICMPKNIWSITYFSLVHYISLNLHLGKWYTFGQKETYPKVICLPYEKWFLRHRQLRIVTIYSVRWMAPILSMHLNMHLPHASGEVVFTLPIVTNSNNLQCEMDDDQETI